MWVEWRSGRPYFFVTRQRDSLRNDRNPIYPPRCRRENLHTARVLADRSRGTNPLRYARERINTTVGLVVFGFASQQIESVWQESCDRFQRFDRAGRASREIQNQGFTADTTDAAAQRGK